MKVPKVSDCVTVEAVCSSGWVSITLVTVVSSPKGDLITRVTTVVTVVSNVRFWSSTRCWSVVTLLASGITITSFLVGSLGLSSFADLIESRVIIFAEGDAGSVDSLGRGEFS